MVASRSLKEVDKNKEPDILRYLNSFIKMGEIPQDCHLIFNPNKRYINYCGNTLMQTFFDTRTIYVYNESFCSPLIQRDDDFRSLLLDHEMTHIEQGRQNRHKTQRTFDFERRRNLDISTLDLSSEERKTVSEDHIRITIYPHLFPFAHLEIEAYQAQLDKIASGERHCSPQFVDFVHRRLALYRSIV